MYTRSITPTSCIDMPINKRNALYLDIKRALFINKKKDSAIAKSYRLGTIWKMLDPFFHAMIYLFVFMVIRFRTNIGTLMVGLALIQNLQSSLMYGARSNLDFSGGLKIERIRTRVIIIADLIHIISDSFIHSFATLLVLLYLGSSWWAVPIVPLIFIGNGLAWYSFGRILSPIVSRFRDFEKFVGYFGTMMFFMSPVLYPLSMTQGIHRTISLYNPFSYFAELSRAVAFGDDSYLLLLPSVGFAIIFLTITFLIYGFWMVDKQRWKWSTWS